MKTSSAVAVVVAIVVIAGATWWIMSQPAAPAASSADNNTTTQTAPAANTTEPASVNVIYGPDGFSPGTVTVQKGGTVTFTAAPGADEMWIASAPHPAHTGYDGTSRQTHCVAGYSGPKPFDQCSSGTSFSFTFNQAGTWPYHDHNNSSQFGTVIVQ